MACNSKEACHTAKRIEIWGSGVAVEQVCGMFLFCAVERHFGVIRCTSLQCDL